MLETYMKFLIPRWITLLFVSCVLFSCAENESEKQVDQDYLDSQEFSSFNQDAIEERLQKAKNITLESRLQQFSQCIDSNQIRIPFDIDSREIISLSEGTSEICTVGNGQQSLKLLGESRLQDQTIRWILLERQTAYRDQELFATTFQGGELRSFNTVGIYKENPSEDIKTEIRVRNKGNVLHVTSRTNRHLLYPIDQQNAVTTEYQIDTDGGIREL